MARRTITLTGRPPVTVDDDAWPVIASAQDHDYEGQYDFQANWHSKWWLTVRQHDDGRAIVYARYLHTSAYQSARDYEARQGVLLPAGTTPVGICDAIRRVAGDIAGMDHRGDDAERWRTLAADCIADMPAEELA